MIEDRSVNNILDFSLVNIKAIKMLNIENNISDKLNKLRGSLKNQKWRQY